MDETQIAQLGLLGNDIAMQWYLVTHPEATRPVPAPVASVNLPGVQGAVNTNFLILGIVAIAAIILLR